MMADPKMDNAATSKDNETGVPSGAPAASETNDANAANADSVKDPSAGSEGSEDAAEDVLDAVLEAEAAAVVDNAMDEVRAEASAEAAQKEASEWKDKYVRLHAEWDNYRRRTKEQQEEQKARAAEKLVMSLLPVIDDLERSIDYAEKNGETGLLDGVKAVLSKFIDTLTKDGVTVLDPVDEPFDALEAQAVGTVENTEKYNETVAEVYQKGYKLGNKVLRPAMVTVTTGGEDRPKEETENEQH